VDEDRFRILAVLEGELCLPNDPQESPLRRGDTALLPAAMGECAVEARGETVVLEMFLP
jgi:mannose-6-phosphate isomerase class I